MLKVTDKLQTVTDGYWGAVDTTTSFCEPHYAWSPVICEFFNSLSSFVYVVVGCYVIAKFSDSFVRASGIWLILIGIGSFLFHATMRYSMQLVDELPMVGFISTIAIAKAQSTHHDTVVKYSKHIQVWILLQALLLVSIYIYFDMYEIFLHGFTFMVLNDVVLGYMLQGHDVPLKRKVNVYAVFFIVLGRIVWELENQLCGSHPHVWPMHSMWHLFSGASAYNAAIYAHLCRHNDSVDLLPANLVAYSSNDTNSVSKKES